SNVTTTERSAAYIGCNGSIPNLTPYDSANGANCSIPSSTHFLEVSISLSGAGPDTNTNTSVPISAASSTARRLSSRLFCRCSAVDAGNIPPLHKLDTFNPESWIMRLLSARPISCNLLRQIEIHGTSASTQPSTASFKLQLLVVIWLRLKFSISGDSYAIIIDLLFNYS